MPSSLSTACLSNTYVHEFHDESSRRFGAAGGADGTSAAGEVTDSTKKRWLQGLFAFMRDRGTPIRKVPTLGRKDLDLYTLYHQVTARGGVKRVIANKLWRSIATALSLPDSCTDYAFRLRLHYVNHLYPYEHCKYLKLADAGSEGDDTFEEHSRAMLAPQKTRIGRKEKGVKRRSADLSSAPAASAKFSRSRPRTSTTSRSRKTTFASSSSTFACDDHDSPPVSPCNDDEDSDTASESECSRGVGTPDRDSVTPDREHDADNVSGLNMSELEVARVMMNFLYSAPGPVLDRDFHDRRNYEHRSKKMRV